MLRAVLVAWLLALPGAVPLPAQEAALPNPLDLRPDPPDAPVSPAEEVGPAEPLPWQTAWGLASLRIFAQGPKIAPNGEKYHPSFSLDLNGNFWIWPSQRIYLFGDLCFWCERPEDGVTNGRDGGLGFSKRQFDLSGGPAWNYAGSWEARVFGYSMSRVRSLWFA